MGVSYNDFRARVREAGSTNEKRRAFMELYAEHRSSIAANFCILMDSRDISNQKMADAIGTISSSVISRGRARISSSGRQDDEAFDKFQLTAYQTYLACYSVFNMSMQEFVFDEVTPVVLPKRFSLVAETVESYMSVAQRLKLCEDLNALLPASRTLDQDEFNELRQARVYEGSAEVYTSCDNFLCPDKHTGLFPIFFEDNDQKRRAKRRGKTDARRVALRTYAFMSVMSGIPIDYFCVRDYTKYLPALYSSSAAGIQESGLKTVCKQYAQSIISTLLQMPEEQQIQVVSNIVRQYWRVDKKVAG